jgi:hypothetical protein
MTFTQRGERVVMVGFMLGFSLERKGVVLV